MDKLSHQSLIETYVHAVKLGLSKEFIQLIEKECLKRNLIYNDIFYEKSNIQ